MKSDSRIDCEGFVHAAWCAAVVARDVDNLDICDCNPCNVCEGAGHVMGDDGHSTEQCGQCGGEPHRKRKTRGRT